jgi:GT2 family glycosyltransferase
MSVLIVSSIVLYKNDKSQLSEAIKSFLNTEMTVRLILVDNSPTDDLSDVIIDDRVDYIFNPDNPGFGAAHNIALKKSLKIGAKYHLVLNPDVHFSKGVLEDIFQYMEKHLFTGNLMPKVLYPDGSMQFLCKLLPTPYDWIGRRFNPLQKMLDKRNHKFELRFTGYNQIMEVPYLSGCFMFLRLDAIKEIGLFDEGIFMYGEDTDLCRRLIVKNYTNIFYPEKFIIHSFAKGSHKSWRLTWIGIKSAIYYFNKWGWFFDSQRSQINNKALKKIGK